MVILVLKYATGATGSDCSTTLIAIVSDTLV